MGFVVRNFVFFVAHRVAANVCFGNTADTAFAAAALDHKRREIRLSRIKQECEWHRKKFSGLFATQRSSTINWTSVCPAAYFDPGERTGRFRLGKDNLVANDKGDHSPLAEAAG
jgi:hypothetical protein